MTSARRNGNGCSGLLGNLLPAICLTIVSVGELVRSQSTLGLLTAIGFGIAAVGFWIATVLSWRARADRDGHEKEETV